MTKLIKYKDGKYYFRDKEVVPCNFMSGDEVIVTGWTNAKPIVKQPRKKVLNSAIRYTLHSKIGGRLLGGESQMTHKLIKLAELIDDRDRQYIPKLGDNGFYF